MLFSYLVSKQDECARVGSPAELVDEVRYKYINGSAEP